MALKFLNKKGWHTGSLRNIENVWKAEQKHGAEQRKLEELRKQIQEERERAEFRLLQEQAGFAPRQERLEFLYESGLGVGKGSSEGFKALQPPKAEPSSSSAAEASTSKAEAPGALFQGDKPQSANEAWRKLHSDPLLLIRQREQEALARIKNNPVQMAMIRKSVEGEKKRKERHSDKKEKKKLKKEEKKKHSRRDSSESRDSEDREEKPRDREERRESDKRQEKPRHREERREYEDRHEKPRHREERRDSEDRQEKPRHREERKEYEDRQEKPRHREERKEYEDRQEKPRYRDERNENEDRQEKPRHREERREFEDQQEKPRHKEERREPDDQREKPRRREERRESEDWRRRAAQQRERPRMSEEERAARLKEMQLDAEVHEEQRWKRIKRASERDVHEAAQDSGGKNFLDAARKSMFGTDAGGSATVEESVRRRTFYLQGGAATAEANSFRRH